MASTSSSSSENNSNASPSATIAASSRSTTLWTHELILQLIELFEANSCLYNVTEESHHDRGKKRKATSEIAKALGIKDEDVTKKIKNVRTQYTCERQKITRRKSGESADHVYVSKWIYYELLKFLNDFVVPKKSISILELNRNDDCFLVVSDCDP
uniref:MADF domain-containing protein n=1 Tax=Amphimedon queenslandica TaxID=400682 RepID=A0A1X7TSI4_AMPQE